MHTVGSWEEASIYGRGTPVLVGCDHALKLSVAAQVSGSADAMEAQAKEEKLMQAQLELEERRAEQDRIHLQLEEHVRSRPYRNPEACLVRCGGWRRAALPRPP